eukprot:TRINITY_DN28527_c0_g1_i1.p1 TRINITY_DN28527_c0_g1~~TRINITY_DN28527_c0_g1_i1.p1  ORF type:complete len:513 (+),score=51.09 TRINITY_DN28527_c0_g1_i1:64-1539(+)
MYVKVALLFCGGAFACGPGQLTHSAPVLQHLVQEVIGKACEPCPKGQFSKDGQLSFCSDCPLGSYAESEGLSECTKCPAGTHMPAWLVFDDPQDDSSLCKPCAAGTYQWAEGESFCEPCPEAHWSTEGSSTCTQCTSSDMSSWMKESDKYGTQISQCAESSSTIFWYIKYLEERGKWICAFVVLALVANMINCYFNGCCWKGASSISTKKLKSRIWKCMCPYLPQPRYWPGWVVFLWDIVDWGLFAWWFLTVQPDSEHDENGVKDFATDPIIRNVGAILLMFGPWLPLCMPLLNRRAYCGLQCVYDALEVGIIWYAGEYHKMGCSNDKVKWLLNVSSTVIDVAIMKGPEVVDSCLADAPMGKKLLDLLDPEGADVLETHMMQAAKSGETAIVVEDACGFSPDDVVSIGGLEQLTITAADVGRSELKVQATSKVAKKIPEEADSAWTSMARIFAVVEAKPAETQYEEIVSGLKHDHAAGSMVVRVTKKKEEA